MVSQITKHLEANNILFKHAVISLGIHVNHTINDFAYALNNKVIDIGILDLSKAFDKVTHQTHTEIRFLWYY